MSSVHGFQQAIAMDPASIIPTESPVPGVPLELATLLVQAIKARRKVLSKSSTPAPADDAATDKLQGMREAADDKTTAFLHELRKLVERSSDSVKISSAPRKKAPSNAPTRCIEFLFGVIADGSNSFHLRRAALALTREILERSSEARASLSEGQCLLDFVSVVESVDNDQPREDGENDGASTSASSMTPWQSFQMEAMELIHHLATKFGKFYTQFTVASRLLGDVSTNLSMTTHDPNDSPAQNGRGANRSNMRMLRRQRDDALERGPKACQSLDRMIERADGYFRILVPRFGGFNIEPTRDNSEDGAEIASDAKPAAESEKIGADHIEDDDDEDSIDWEEGDVDFSGSDNDFNEDAPESRSDFLGAKEHPAPEDHKAAVEQTLDIMGRGGALLDGQLAVQVGSGGNDMGHATAAIHNTNDPADLDTAPTSQTNDTSEARQKLQIIVEKLSSRRLPRINQWIHALSRADGMEERAVLDPAAAAVTGQEGPVSLVLLSEEKRKLRGELLQRMMKARKEVESVLQSAAKLGILPEAASASDTAMANRNNDDTPSMDRAEVVAGMKRQYADARDIFALSNKRKKPKHSRVKIKYNKR